jgi:type IV pilus assembly protein PilA
MIRHVSEVIVKSFCLAAILVLQSSIALWAQTQPAPQTARQALLEMFFSKTPGALEKHLPEATRTALHKADAQSAYSMLQGFSTMTSQLSANGAQLQTFEAGTTLLIAEDTRNQSKMEIVVERDDLQGDEDEIEVTFHAYRAGQEQNSFLMPRLTFVMNQEAGIWKLRDLMLTLRVSLADPKLLQRMTTNMKQSAISADEATAVAAIRIINTAEVTYSTAYPARGFTCTLTDLDGLGGGEVNEHHAMLIDLRLASGKKNGYIFSLSACDANPASRYSVTALPAQAANGQRAFCSDQSGVIRYSMDGKAETCLSAGKPLQ